jgi:hypothetical protein
MKRLALNGSQWMYAAERDSGEVDPRLGGKFLNSDFVDKFSHPGNAARALQGKLPLIKGCDRTAESYRRAARFDLQVTKGGTGLAGQKQLDAMGESSIFSVDREVRTGGHD